jgi:hypothetical protein
MFVPQSQNNGGCIQTVSPPRPDQLAQDGPARVRLALARGVQGLAHGFTSGCGATCH